MTLSEKLREFAFDCEALGSDHRADILHEAADRLEELESGGENHGTEENAETA